MSARTFEQSSPEIQREMAELAEFVATWTDDDFLAIFGDANPDELTSRMMRADEDCLGQAELEAEFPGQWVAGHDCQVVGHAPTLMQLREEMRAKGTWLSPKAIRHMPGQ